MKETIENLTDLLQKADYHYYQLGNAIMSDEKYDAILQKLKGLEEKYPEWADPNSPTLRLGSDLKPGAATYPHPEPMLSIQSAYRMEDFLTLTRSIHTWPVGVEPRLYSVEEKLDGISVELNYEKGRLKRALSRGDGHRGQDITANIRTVKNIPLMIEPKGDVFLRGEVVISEKDLKAYNRVRAQKGMEELKNCRSAASTLIMQSTSREASKALLHGMFYWVSGRITQKQMFTFLTDNHFNTPLHVSDVSIENIETTVMSIGRSEYPSDGVVVKADHPLMREILSHGKKNVNWAYALKPKTGGILTPFVMVEYLLSPQGLITPVVHFKGVNIQGITYSKVKVSYQQLQMLNPCIGQQLLISVKGGVAAEINAVTGNAFYQVPIAKSCPCCKEPLTQVKESIYCMNKLCPDKIHNYKHLTTTGVKVFKPGNENGNIQNMRFAALSTDVKVVRQCKGSVTPVLLYKSNSEIDRIMYIAGLIYHK